MTDLERSALAECEAVIERGVKTFVEVGQAILRIRDDRLYRDEYGTFEEYCQKRWKWKRRYGDRLIEAAHVVANLSPIGLTPKNEAQTRELARVAPEQQRKVWDAALAQSSSGQPTARQIAQALAAIEKEELPSPEEARRIAIETGKPVLDSEKWYQPPVTVEHEEAVASTLDLFDLIIGFPDCELLQYTPREVLDRFATLRENPEKQKLRRVSLARLIAWLTEFENERKKGCK